MINNSFFLALGLAFLFTIGNASTAHAQIFKQKEEKSESKQEKTSLWDKLMKEEAPEEEVVEEPNLKERLFGKQEQQKGLKADHKVAKAEHRTLKKERKAAEAREKAAKARADAIKAERKAIRAEKQSFRKDDKADKARTKANGEKSGNFLDDLFGNL